MVPRGITEAATSLPFLSPRSPHPPFALLIYIYDNYRAAALQWAGRRLGRGSRCAMGRDWLGSPRGSARRGGEEGAWPARARLGMPELVLGSYRSALQGALQSQLRWIDSDSASQSQSVVCACTSSSCWRPLLDSTSVCAGTYSLTVSNYVRRRSSSAQSSSSLSRWVLPSVTFIRSSTTLIIMDCVSVCVCV